MDIAKLAGRQKGYVTWAQLIRLGLSRHDISGRVRRGFLLKVHRTVYAVGHLPQSPIQRAYAAVLACGPGAVLSHGSAATAFGIYRRWDEPFEITAPTQHSHKGIRAHRAKPLDPKDIRTHHGIRMTSPPKTIIDIAPRLSDKFLTRAINDQRRAGYDFAGPVDRAGRKRGIDRVRAAADLNQNPTRSKLEDRFLALCRRYGLPTPEVNVYINGYEVDALFREQRVIVELDGYQFHKDKATFESDRERDATHLETDHVTVRVTDARVKRTPRKEAQRLSKILSRRS